MIRFFDNTAVYLLWLLLRQAHISIFFAVAFKGLFILFQVSAIWIMISWVSGAMLPLVKGLLHLNDSSYVYLSIGWALLVFSSVAAFFSRWLALNGIKKLERYVSEKIKGKGLVVSDYRNLTKMMLGLIDAFVPAIFIGVVLAAWLIQMPELLLPFIVLVILVGLFFRKGVRFSASKFKRAGGRIDPKRYIGSDDHQHFYQILMVSQYISLAIYTLIATSIVAALIFIQTFSESLLSLGILPIATAVAILQLKSFVGLLVRLGAYASNASRIAQLVKLAS